VRGSVLKSSEASYDASVIHVRRSSLHLSADAAGTLTGSQRSNRDKQSASCWAQVLTPKFRQVDWRSG